MSYSSFRRPLLKPLLPCAKKEEEEKEETTLFDLLFSSSSSSSFSSEREREREEKERCLQKFFFFFSLFFFSAVEETFDLFAASAKTREKKWNCLEARDRHRTSISPRSLTSSTITTASPGKETRAVRRTVMRPRSGPCQASYRPRICA